MRGDAWSANLFIKDTGYTHICPVCSKRWGDGVPGSVREITFADCGEHKSLIDRELKTKVQEVISLRLKGGKSK